MPGTHKTEHVRLRVDDLQEASDFYRNVLGLTEIAEQDGATYLGCGLDCNYDLALSEGDTGVEHVAVRVSDPATVDEYKSRLDEEGVRTTRTDGVEPGQTHGLRVRLPSEIAVEFVVVEDTDYAHTGAPKMDGRSRGAPLDLNHYAFLSPNVKRDAQFLSELLEFDVSEVVGDDWSGGAFLRHGDAHHDIALFNMPETPPHASHHHTAFTVSNVDHMVALTDTICRAGIPLELGIGRHFAGDNLYAYFRAPGGHRIELSTSMATLDENTSTNRIDNVPTAASAWQTDIELPESFTRGSGLIR